MNESPRLFSTEAADGTPVQALDEGDGPVILIVHPGMDDGTSWAKVARQLALRFRVLRLRRRRYRFDLEYDRSLTLEEEATDIFAIAEAIEQRLLIVGHSSGGIVALEALADRPEAFAGGVVYEPPLVTELPLGSPKAERAAEDAVTAGRPGAAFRIFLRDIVESPAWQAALSGAIVDVSARWPGRKPRQVALAPRQIDDTLAISRLGNRLDSYASIGVPVMLLGGDRSPAHLARRLDALQAVIGSTERVTMSGQGHGAQGMAPKRLANLIAEFAGRVLTK